MKKIDVLWLVEHKARELDIACAVKSLAQTYYGLDITVRNMYFDAKEVMEKYVPRLVVFPYFYRSSDAMVQDYIQLWPRSTYFNLAMEQVHYKAHLAMKAPGDDLTRKKVIHHAWGNFYKSYLATSGVPSEHIFVNGNPVYQLYKKPYSDYFTQRMRLAENNGLDPAKKWVFIPENYKWAFFSDAKLGASAKRGGNMEEHLMMRAFCRESLAQLLLWCNEAGRNDGLEIIFRPRPATNSQLMDEFFREHVGAPTRQLHFTKAETVREWILASDVVMSSYSTSLIESAIAGKPIYMVEPIPIPEALSCDWYGLVSRIYNTVEFEQACLTPAKNNNCDLQTWAEGEMLSNGDPIKGLADFIAGLVQGNSKSSRNGMKSSASVSNSPMLVLTSLNYRAQRRTRRVISYSRPALHSLFSAIKLVLSYIAAKVQPHGARRKLLKKGVMRGKLKDRLTRMVDTFSQGFEDTIRFNTVYFENDVFTELDVNKRAEAWREILTND